MESQESPFWRGLKLGIGFMLAVAVILFLLALLMTWFFQEGWQPWGDGVQWPHQNSYATS
jgi:O-antigen/teichoic acid export membrane protein